MQGSISNNKTKLHLIMFLVDLEHDNTPHEGFSNFQGKGSGGSMKNPMYRKVCSIGCYEPQTGRNKKRYAQRERLKTTRRQSISYGKPHCIKTNGFA